MKPHRILAILAFVLLLVSQLAVPLPLGTIAIGLLCFGLYLV